MARALPAQHWSQFWLPKFNIHVFVQVLSWGACPTAPLGGQRPAAVAMPWNAEVALLLAQLGALNMHDNQLLPSSLVQQDMGLDTAAIADRYAKSPQVYVV